MATDAVIAQLASQAVALNLVPGQMVALADRAIAELLLGKPSVSYAFGGRTMTFASMQQAVAVRDYYNDQLRAGTNCIDMTVAEL